MRRILFAIIAFLMINILNAQDKKVQPVNELRIDAIRAIGLGTLGVSYERIIKQDMGLGATMDVRFADNDHPDFVFSPYYRFYFYNNQDFGARGLFVELFSSFVSHTFEEPEYVTYDKVNVEKQKFFDVAMGLSLGKKWVHKRNYIFEINGGVGRFLGFDENTQQGSFFPRFNIAVGYRF